MKKYFVPVFALLALYSCDPSLTPVEQTPDEPDNVEQQFSYEVSFAVEKPQTKVIYHDNINDPVKTDGDGTFMMDWKEGDQVVAIRWPGREQRSNEVPTDWFTLTAKYYGDGEDAKILFDCSKASFPIDNPLRQGERFVLIHGDFVLGDSNDKASLSFPISRFKFPDSKICYGGTKTSDNQILFEGQNGTLDGLSRHEYMVADAYVNIVNPDPDNTNPDAKGLIQLTSVPVEPTPGVLNNSTDPIKLTSVSTIIRLQAFVPDSYFTGDKDDEKIQAMSISTVGKTMVFYRYFRMHPNQQDAESESVPGWVAGKENNVWMNYWGSDANTKSECNPYLRIDLDNPFDPTEGDNSAQDQLISKAYTNRAGVAGRLITAYFAIPSRPLSTSEEAEVEHLKFCLFTDSHAYKTKGTYTISKAAMKPGNVVNVTINFGSNVDEINADTNAKLGVTFSPGFVYAEKDKNGVWQYGMYQHQGEYAGMVNQSLDFGEYFVFGSKDPTECYHRIKNADGSVYVVKGKNYYGSPDKVDVSELIEVNGATKIFTIPTKLEADRLYERVISEKNSCIGYYYYPVSSTSDRTYHLSANAKKKMATVGIPDDGRVYAGSYGIWIGTESQPQYDDQDRYIFLPDSKQFSNNDNHIAYGFDKVEGKGYKIDQKGYLYYPGPGWAEEESTLKYSANTCEEAPANGKCYRLQFWYRGTGFIAGSTNVSALEVDYGRPVRSVIY